MRYAGLEANIEKVVERLLQYARFAKEHEKAGGLCDSIQELTSNLRIVLSSPIQARSDFRLGRQRKSLKELKATLRDLPARLKHFGESILTNATRLLKLCEDALPYAVEREKLGRLKPPAFDVRIDAFRLSSVLTRKQAWIVKRLAEFREREPEQAELRAFLEESRPVVQCVCKLFQQKDVLRAIVANPDSTHIRDTSTCRLEMSVHRIFDCGQNVLLLGEAGAGKTTSLQMYAKSRMTDAERIYLYLALAPMFSSTRTKVTEDKSSRADLLLRHIAAYLVLKGCNISEKDISNLLNDGRVVLMLDGVDEVIASTSWIVEALRGLSAQYRASQFLVASRTSGPYSDALPFTTITLLPFSTKQRSVFVRGWFSTGEKRVHAKHVIAHLTRHQQLAGAVKNPLLATVLCTLQEYGIPLPETEGMLYDARLDLLLRTYDIHKQTSRITSRYEDLIAVAERIAYYLHDAHTRQAEMDKVYAVAEGLARYDERRTAYRRAVDELLHPCNILMPMTDDGKVGFGHLRYQEHLAARYLRVHRDVELTVLAREQWWQDVFVLMALLEPDIEWLVGTLLVDAARSSRRTLEAVIATQPPRERRRLRGVVQRHRYLDRTERSLFGDY